MSIFLLSYFSSWKSFKAVYAEKVWYCEADLAVLFCLLLKVGKFGRPFIFTFHIAISWKANPKDMFRKIWFAKCIAGKKVHCPKYIAGRIYFAEIYCGQEPWKSHLSSLMGLFSLVICQWKWIKISCIFYWGVGTKPSNPSLLDEYEARALEVPSIICSIFRSPPCLSYECFQLNGPTLCCFASVITWSTVFSVLSLHIHFCWAFNSDPFYCLVMLHTMNVWKCISSISKRYFCSRYSKRFKVLYKLFSN